MAMYVFNLLTSMRSIVGMSLIAQQVQDTALFLCPLMCQNFARVKSMNISTQAEIVSLICSVQD